MGLGNLGTRVRDARKARQLSQEALAREAGLSLNLVNKLERGVVTDPHYSTLAGLARALQMSIEELLEKPVLAGKAEAPEEAGRAGTHGLSAEHQATPGWRRAFDNSRRFLFSQAKTRLREQLSLWETARNKGASSAERREFLDAMGRILDEASNVSNELMENLGEGLDGMSEPEPSPYWTECQKADTLYRELFGMIGEAGLSVRAKKTEQAPGQLRYELLEVA